MKKFTFKGVLDGFRSSVQDNKDSRKPEQEIQETLRPDNFQLKKTFRHGFPHAPTSLAYDPIQKLLAIGDKSGSLRILGRAGVDIHVRHDGDSACAVVLIQFLVNEGAFVTATADDTLHLWNFRQKSPQITQSLKFQRERITCLHLAVASKWMYVGTEKGNIHVVHIDTFALSGYIINWNKAIDVITKSHPGSVVHLSDNPLDSNKLLIGFESGLLVVWDMRGKAAEFRWVAHEPLRSASWHFEGKHFVTSHTDGSLCTWPLRVQPKPQLHSYPHAKPTKDGKLESCKPIHKVELKTQRNGENFTIFSGGLSMERGGKSPCITVLQQGKSTTVLEMEHPVVDFITICESPWISDMQEPYAIAVLLQNDLVLIDLTTPGYPCFESPYAMDLHESPVTCTTYLADCPGDLVPAFYSVGKSASQRKSGYSDREWPISGGEWAPASISYSEIIITGHQDGSVKFWDASAGTLQVLYKMKTSKIFERPKSRSMDGCDDDPLAIQIISLCAESRRLCIAGNSGHVVLFKFKKAECNSETLVLEIPITYETFEDPESPECEFVPRSLPKQPESVDVEKKNDGMLKVRPGPQRKPAGFQAQLVCLTPWTTGSHPGQITSLCINSSYGLMAYGNEYGLALVDIVQKVCLLNVASPDLYGAQDPYSRQPRSPKRTDTAQSRDEQARSPSIDQFPELASSPQKASSTVTTDAEDTSNPNSRPPSPAEEAVEGISPVPGEEGSAATGSEGGAVKRKQSLLKGFSLKKQLSRAEIKIKNTFKESARKGSVFYTTPTTEGATLSPIEISPDTEPSSEPTSSPITAEERPNYLDELEKDVAKNLTELAVSRDSTVEAAVSESAVDEELTVDNSLPKSETSDRKRTVSVPQPMPKRVEFKEERTTAARPSDLPLDELDDGPLRPPRIKKADKQRLMSVPNIALQDVTKPKDFRSKSAKGKGNFIKKFNKLDSSFSRSRSSSMSSLENITSESVTCLAFADSYTKKSDPSALLPTLWVGTSLGSVLTVSISYSDMDSRKTQPVLVSILGGPIFRLKGSILTMSFLDCNGALIPYSYEAWRDENKESRRDRTPTKTTNRMSPTLGGCSQDSFSDRQFIVICSEKQARVVALPSQNCVYRQQITDTDFLVKAEVISMKDSVCLVCYSSSGRILAYTLPSLRPLLDNEFLPLADLSFQTKCKQGIVDPMLSIWGQQLIVHEDSNQISKTFCFSNKGHGLYLATPTEVQKFTICNEFCQLFNEMIAELYMQHEMPEPPKESFFKGLFGGGMRNLDREELFGEQSGKANRSVAKHIPGPSMEQINARAGTAAGDISRAHQMMLERGDKLNQLEERTERMHNTAQEFGGTAHQLMTKYRDKKWYQL